MKKSEEDVELISLKEAVTCLNERVSLFCIILEQGIPYKTKGTDFCVTLKLIDDSHPSPGVSVNFFASTLEALPRVHSTGDIIQLSHVLFRTHHNLVYAQFNKTLSSFVLFHGHHHSTDFLPYLASRNFHRCLLKHKGFVSRLRTWLDTNPLDTGDKESLPLKELKQDVPLNFVCKVLHSCEVSEGQWMAFIWDGTDAPPVSIEAKLEDERRHPLPLHLEPSVLRRDVLCTFPTVGTILRVLADGDEGNRVLSLLNTGKWVKFHNMVAKIHVGLWCGKVMSFSRLRYIPNEDTIVSDRQRSYGQRILTKWDRKPMSCFDKPSSVTETELDNAPFVTLMDMLTYREVTAKFKCVVRVTAIFPWEAETFISPDGIYRFRLTLEDPTARVHAFVYAEDGEKFLDGYHSVDVLNRKRKRLLGEGEDDNESVSKARNPPWFQCCIKSYYIDEDDVWGSRNYRIFGTKLLG